MGHAGPHLVGQGVPRKEGREKVAGRARYVDDLTLPDMLHGATVRSQEPRGRIRQISFGPGIPWEQFTVVTARDIPGKNVVALIENDQPFLADEVVNHPEEAVVLLAHADKNLLEKARRAITIEIDPLPAVFNIEDSLAQKEIIWGQDNILKSFLLDKGNVDDVWAGAGLIVEGEYFTGAQEQLYIETQGMLAVANGAEGVTVWGSLQCPYYVQKALMSLFGFAAEKVRIVQAETGGGFGGKEEYPSMIAGHAALLAWKSGRPVKIVYDRAEDMAATTKRHPARIRHRTAVSREGQFQAMEIDLAIDGGAYATLSSVVLSRATIHAAGPYACPNVRIRSTALATNTPPQGAFRGFGAPQSIFALERQLDKVAAAVGLPPEELRRRNFLTTGTATATGQTITEPINLSGLLDRALKYSDYRAKRERFASENPGRRVKRGIGVASFMHGAGFTGSGEQYLASIVEAEATPEGRVRILAASTEIGQGTNTIFSQIAAEALRLPEEYIEVAQPDTASVPNSGPTVASRTSMVVGKLVESAVCSLRQSLVDCRLIGTDYTPAEFAIACRRYLKMHGPLRARSQYQPPPGLQWDDQHYRGDAYGAFGWAVYVAEVTVDTLTYQTEVVDFVALQEIGRVLNPLLATGQIQGGVAQGIGYALYENVVWDRGRMVNGQMTNYIMPTSMDLPLIRVYFEEQPYAFGPGGAKGIGELPMDGPAPAIASAIENAVGVFVNEIPATPERLMDKVADVAEKAGTGA
jgi:CO/xanthine dehydrogenase Mo-binding subunit